MKRLADLPGPAETCRRGAENVLPRLVAGGRRQALNRLCDALGEFSAAAKLGYTASAGVPAQTVQDAIENVQKQVRDASVGKLPSGCVDGDKLAETRNRLTAIEHAAESETNARTAADTDLQSDMNTVKTTLTVKTACHFGTYTGDGTENVPSRLHHPEAVLVAPRGCYTGYSSAIYGGLVSEDVPLMCNDMSAPGVTADGFQLLNSPQLRYQFERIYSFAVCVKMGKTPRGSFLGGFVFSLS